MRRIRTAMAIACASTLLVVGACSSSKTSTGGGNKALDDVTYVTGFGTFGREAYAWYGLDKGYFHDEGINLKIVPGAGGAANLPLLATGKAQFAVIDYSGAVVNVGKGETDFKIISAIHQRTLIALMAIRDKGGISRPQDLPGKTVGVATGAVPKTLFPAYARLANISDKVTWVNSDPATLPSLLVSGKVQAIGQFVYGEPAVKAAAVAGGIQNPQIVVLAYSDYMSDLYGSVLVTPTSLIKSNPDLVRRFNRAYYKSLAASLNDPTGTGQILNKYVPTQKVAPAAAEVGLMKPYTGDPSQLGAMSEVQVAKGIALLQSAGMIPKAFDPKDLVAFDFVPHASA